MNIRSDFIRNLRLLLLPAVAVLTIIYSNQQAATAQKSPGFSAGQLEFFEKKIRPVLVQYCYGCHSAQSGRVKGRLRVDSRVSLLKGGTSGQPAIVPGDPEKSQIIAAIRFNQSALQMPPGGKLTAQQIMDFEEWVKSGAAMPAEKKKRPRDSDADN
jgi:hypothetical protein